MNITASAVTESNGTIKVTINSSVQLHPDTLWAVASQACADYAGVTVSRLSRFYEANQLVQRNSADGEHVYVADFLQFG